MLNTVEICNTSLLFELWEFIVTGQGGNLDIRSSVQLKEHCKYCGLKRYEHAKKGLFIDKAQWDGSDIFSVVEYPGMIIITEKVKVIMETNGLKGFSLIALEDFK